MCKDTKPPTVTAVLPTFNRVDHLRRSIDSILTQTVRTNEIVVVDDGSTDGTVAFLQSTYGDVLRLIRQENRGVGGALHRGILESTSEWIAIANSDDEWFPDHLERLTSVIADVPDDVAWIFGDTIVVTDSGPAGTVYSEFGFHMEQQLRVFDDALAAHYPYQFGLLQSSLIRRDALLRLNCFAEHLRSSEDVLAGLQIACHYGCAAIADPVSKLYRTSELRDSSLSRAGLCGIDYYRARVIGFEHVIQHRGPSSWAKLHEQAVRGWCKAAAGKGANARRLALRQFRYRSSIPALAFLLAALMGRPGLAAWEHMIEARERKSRIKDAEPEHSLV